MTMFLFVVLSFTTATAAITTSTYNNCAEDCSNENCARIDDVCVWGGADAFRSSVEKFRVQHNIKKSRELKVATWTNKTGEQHVKFGDQTYSFERLRTYSVLGRNFVAAGPLPGSPVSKVALPDGGELMVFKDVLGNPETIMIDDGSDVTHLFALDPINHPTVFISVGADDFDLEDLNSRFKFGHKNSSSNATFLHRKLDMKPSTRMRRMSNGCGKDKKSIEIAIEADSSFCSHFGGSLKAHAQIQKLIAMVSTMYQRNGLCLQVALSSATVNCEPGTDPYAKMNRQSSGCTEPGFLDDVMQFWRKRSPTAPHRDVAHVFTGARFVGGVVGCANTRNLCNSNSYGVIRITYTSNFLLQSTLFAHELGHNAGSHHWVGPGNIMNPKVQVANRFSFDAVEEILGYVDPQACIKFPPLSHAGIRDWSTCFQGFNGGHVDGRNVVNLQAGQRVVSWDCDFECCTFGSRVDGTNVRIINEGARVVNKKGNYLNYDPTGGHGGAITLEVGDKVVSWNGDFKEYAGGNFDNNNVRILKAGTVAVVFNGKCHLDYNHNIIFRNKVVFMKADERINCLDNTQGKEQAEIPANKTESDGANTRALGPALLAGTVTSSVLVIMFA